MPEHDTSMELADDLHKLISNVEWICRGYLSVIESVIDLDDLREADEFAKSTYARQAGEAIRDYFTDTMELKNDNSTMIEFFMAQYLDSINWHQLGEHCLEDFEDGNS